MRTATRRAQDPAAAENNDRPPRSRSGRVVKIFVVAAVLLSIVGLVSTRWIRSPQQRVAESASPPPTVLTVQVERRVLKETVVLRGQVSAGRAIEVNPAASATSRPVITAVRVRAGQRFSAGKVLVEVAGRPVVALPGSIPAYRDLRPGSKGKDVRQLQNALRAKGYRIGDKSGSFGPGTKSALAKFYDRIGYEPATTGDDDARVLEEQADAVGLAQRAYEDAKRAAGKAPAGTARQQANRARRDAADELHRAQERLTKLQSRTGTMLPMAEVVFLPSFPGRVEKLNAAIGAEVKPPLMTVSSGDLVIKANVSNAQRQLLKEGMTVRAVSDATGETREARVISFGTVGTDETGARSFPMVVRPIGSKLADNLAGANLRLTVETASTDDPVLVVPLTALYTATNGQTTVQRRTADGRTQDLAVTVGSTGSGYAAVTATAGELAEGDAVVVGKA